MSLILESQVLIRHSTHKKRLKIVLLNETPFLVFVGRVYTVRDVVFHERQLIHILAILTQNKMRGMGHLR